ncbi:MAG: hypothetical protein LBH04_03670 [Tannerellaceae bacterium]|jgi:hypothetical protein|nr:hypothetical protein [Tannerellaceae bacterium]
MIRCGRSADTYRRTVRTVSANRPTRTGILADTYRRFISCVTEILWMRGLDGLPLLLEFYGRAGGFFILHVALSPSAELHFSGNGYTLIYIGG